MKNYAILIDGGFIKRKLAKGPKSPMQASDIQNFVDSIKNHELLLGSNLYRIYYYDSQPLKNSEKNPLSQEILDFGSHPVVQSAEALFKGLSNIPFLALRIGELSFNGWDLKPRLLKTPSQSLTITPADLRPSITQKGVDMRIGMDMAALSLKKQVDIIVLATGDSDFVPAMKFVRREGINLFLAKLGHKVKKSMILHSDYLLN
jgi:uncharacterized LabA/DUF88 family protein